VTEQAAHLDQPVALETRGGRDGVAPGRGLDAIAAESGVDLQVHPGWSADGCRGLRHGAELLDRRDAEVDVSGDRRIEVGAGIVQPGEHGRVHTGRTQRDRLLDVGDAEASAARADGSAPCP
jgi:hypothetical protein